MIIEASVPTIPESVLNLVSSIIQYILWGTIVLGIIFLLIFGIMIGKRIQYSSQMRKNKKEKKKLLKNLELTHQKELEAQENL